MIFTDFRCTAIEANLGTAAAKWADRNAAAWVLDGLADPRTAKALGKQVLPAGLMAPATGPTCPGCSGDGVLTDDPQVLRCESCGGVFSAEGFPITVQQAGQFVNLGLPMLANAGADGQFYFDLNVTGINAAARRFHGWADRQTKRVVQWG